MMSWLARLDQTVWAWMKRRVRKGRHRSAGMSTAQAVTYWRAVS